MIPASPVLQKAQSLVSCSVCFCSSGNLPQRLFNSLACESHLWSFPKHQGYWPRAEWLWRLTGRCSFLVPWPSVAPKLPEQPAVTVFAVSCSGRVGVCVCSSRVLVMSFCLRFWVGLFSFMKGTPPPYLFIGLASMSVRVCFGFFLQKNLLPQ